MSDYEFVPHQFSRGFTVGGKAFCPRCGLIALNNEFTGWAISKGCNNADHPSFESKIKRYGRKV